MLLFLESLPYVVIFIFGITIGSFLNVCIYRIPLHESIVTAPSHCMSCGARLHWYDMVPVFSWLALGGKCRNCKASISVQYPIIEAANGVLYVIISLRNGLNIFTVLYCLMASALLTLSVIDWRTYEIPLGINLFLAGLGVIATILDRQHLADHLIGAVCVSAFLALLYFISGGAAIGGGDIKLMAACGLLLGWKKIILSFLLGCILGSIIHPFRMKHASQTNLLALGPYLSAALILTTLYGDPWITWYLSKLGL